MIISYASTTSDFLANILHHLLLPSVTPDKENNIFSFSGRLRTFGGLESGEAVMIQQISGGLWRRSKSSGCRTDVVVGRVFFFFGIVALEANSMSATGSGEAKVPDEAP